MIKKILTILMIILATQYSAFAHNYHGDFSPKKPNIQEQRKMDAFLNEKLNLTEEQQQKITKIRSHHKKNMSKIIKKMEIQRDKIKEVYLIGIPKFQADLKTAPMKAELVKLKQEADKLRMEYRKSFEEILTEEQKVKFLQIKKEFNKKHHSNQRP